MSDADAPEPDPDAADPREDANERHETPVESEDHEAHVEVVRARGHENVTAEHASTFEFTTDDWLTPAGDCIVGVAADRTPRDFSAAFREACRDPDATITATITVEENGDGGRTHTARIVGRGDPGLALVDDRSMVGRTSEYTDDERTILVDADAAAADLDRDLVAALAGGREVEVELRLEVRP
ncbi:DUF371 domain-containing protein [Halorubrum halodurans]|uniref:DUF371 domain-containing protein n=1 Tax=Halorubrum halodurans TaxID=1383851 RepID=A0A256IQ24_9EURY|nr:DUF371 domain-containing protein [Halorubrum halodurans]OYR58227.1 hypothetical protein DJ70_03820 [Halorubrum halodurans]